MDISMAITVNIYLLSIVLCQMQIEEMVRSHYTKRLMPQNKIGWATNTPTAVLICVLTENAQSLISAAVKGFLKSV